MDLCINWNFTRSSVHINGTMLYIQYFPAKNMIYTMRGGDDEGIYIETQDLFFQHCLYLSFIHLDLFTKNKLGGGQSSYIVKVACAAKKGKVLLDFYYRQGYTI